MKPNKELAEIGNKILSYKGSGYDRVLLNELEGMDRAFGVYILSAQREGFIKNRFTARTAAKKLKAVQKEDFSEFRKISDGEK